MACIGRIGVSLSMPCGAPNPGDIGRPVTAKLLNASDIASFTVSGLGSATITRAATAVSYEVTAVNNSLTVSVGLKSQDIRPGAYDVSITFKNFRSAVALSTTPLGAADVISRAELVIAVEHASGVYRVYGLGAPLVCTELVGDSTASEYYTYTFGVEDWQVGTTIHSLTKADYDALSTPAGTAPGA